MSDPEQEKPPSDAEEQLQPSLSDEPEEGEQRDSDPELESEIRKLLGGAIRAEEETPSSDVLEGVQKRLRERSGGKFYSEGWSTERHQPISMYLVTSALMLSVIIVVYAVLGPLSGQPVAVPMTPAPVRILGPARRMTAPLPSTRTPPAPSPPPSASAPP